jgi:hypothetical protein
MMQKTKSHAQKQFPAPETFVHELYRSIGSEYSYAVLRTETWVQSTLRLSIPSN